MAMTQYPQQGFPQQGQFQQAPQGYPQQFQQAPQQAPAGYPQGYPQQQAAPAGYPQQAPQQYPPQQQAPAGDENPFDVDHGMADEYILDVRDAYFSTDANYQNGQALLLILEGVDRDSGKDRKEFWSVGNDWTPQMNGAVVTHAKGKKNFIDVSTLGKIVWRIKNGDAGPEARAHFVDGMLDPKRADTWKGLSWQMAPVEEETIEKNEDGSRKKKIVRRPVKFLGKVGQQQQAAPQQFQQAPPVPYQQIPQQAPLGPQSYPQQFTGAPANGPAPGSYPVPGPSAQPGFASQQFQQPIPQQQPQQAPPQQPQQQPQAPAAGTPNPWPMDQLKQIAATCADNNGFLMAAGPIAQQYAGDTSFMSAMMSGQLFAQLRAQ